MANRITTQFEFTEKGSGLSRIKREMADADGVFAKAKAGFKASIDEFRQSNTAQAAAIGALGTAAYKAIGLASDLQESVNAVTVSYGENAEAVLAIGENAAESFGLSRTEFNEFSVQFSSFAKQIAERDGRQVSDVIQELMTRTADFASVMNIDAAQAAQVFMSTLAGETEPIRRYGKDVSAAAVEHYALANGLVETKSEMTEAVKIQARYGLLMRETSEWTGDFANTSDSLANSQRTLSAQAQDLGAEFGEVLAPALESVVGGLSSLMSGLDEIGFTEHTQELLDFETQGLNAGQALRKLWDGGAAEKNREYADTLNAAVDAGELFDQGLLENAESAAEVRAIAEEYASTLEDVEDQQLVVAKVLADWGREQRRATELEEEAKEAVLRHAESLRQNAAEATYTATAQEELGTIQAAVTATTDAAAEAQREFMESIRHTRDEVGALKREIDDEQAWLNLQTAMEDTIAKMGDAETSARDQRLAILDLKEEVIAYAESIDLPDEVITRIVADLDDGKIAEVDAFLARMGNGVTLPIKPVVIQTSGSTSIRVDENGNVRGFASGTRYAPGGLAVVGEDGPEIVNLPAGARVQSAQTTQRTMADAGRPSIVIDMSGATFIGEPTDRTLDRWADAMQQRLKGRL